MAAEPDLYAELRVSPHSEGATRKHHQDANRSAEATLRCAAVNQAYEVLADHPVALADYDARRLPAAADAYVVRRRVASKRTTRSIESAVLFVGWLLVIASIVMVQQLTSPVHKQQEPLKQHCYATDARSPEKCPVVVTPIIPAPGASGG